MAKIKKAHIVAPVANVADVPSSARREPTAPPAQAKREFVEFGQARVLKRPEPDPDFTPTGQIFRTAKEHNPLEIVAWAISSNLDVLLLGDTGVGKTSLVRFLAQETNNAYRRFPCSDATDVSSLVGQMLVDDQGTYFQKGVVYDALETGKWLLLDEINAALPEVRLRLNSIYQIDEGVLVVPENKGEVVRRHRDFRLFATANPYSYAGVKEMNQAIMSRFDVVVELPYLPEDEECALLLETVRVKSVLARQMVRAANKVRQARATEQEIRFPMSFRELRAWAMASQRFGVQAAAEFTVIHKCDDADKDPVRTLLRGQFPATEWSR